MKVRPNMVDWAKPLSGLMVLPVVFYVFTRNQLYSLIVQALESIFPSLQIYQTPILVFFAAVLLTLIVFGNEEVVSIIFIFLAILLTPSILWFSKLDWFRMFGLPFDLETLSANLQVSVVCIASLLLVTTRVFLSHVFQIKDTRQELLQRGASELDTRKTVAKQSSLTSTLLLGCFGAALLIFAAASTVEVFLRTSPIQMPYPYIIFGLIIAVMLIICTVLYLRSNVEIADKRPTSELHAQVDSNSRFQTTIGENPEN